MSGLPKTLVGLRRALGQGVLTQAEALRMQGTSAMSAHPAVIALHQDMIDAAMDSRQHPHQGSLAGVALAHKDIFDLPGRAPGCGRASALDGFVPRRGARALTQLEQAGAINIAALAMAEFACGATAENRNLAPLPNPVDPAAVVGGSSSGSAVAVASGYCYASLGTDTFGSVRIPAATCGVFGFKPTWGAISSEGAFPLAPSLDTIGILALNAADTELVYGVLVDPTPPASLEKRRQQWRVACLIEDKGLDSQVGDALARFEGQLREVAHTHRVVNAASKIHAYAQTVLHAEAFATHKQRMRQPLDDMAPSTLSVLAPGVALPMAWYQQALDQRAACYHAFLDHYLADADVLLIPALPRPVPDWAVTYRSAPGFEAHELLALHAWMPWANYLGMPSAVLPIGKDARGRPISAQLMARRGEDQSLLSFCREVQAVLGDALPDFSDSPERAHARLS